MEQNKDQIGAAVRGEAVAEFAYKGADGKFLDSGAWWVDNSEISCHMALPILRNGEVIAMVFAEAIDGCKEAIEENCRLLCAAANSSAPVSARAADAPSEPSVKMLSGALNHARDTLRFYAEQEHFVRHQPDSWDAVSGEPQSLYEDASNTATVEDGTLAKNTLNDIAGVEAYASVAADALDSQPSTDEPTDRESLIACLGDDAVTLLRANPDDEMAQTMREAAAMLENDGKVLESQPTRPSPADAPPLKFRTLLEQCMVVLADAGWRSSPPIAGLRNLYEQIEKALTMEALDSQPTETVAPPVLDDASWRAGIKAFRAALNEMTGRDGYVVQETYKAIYASLSSQPTDPTGYVRISELKKLESNRVAGVGMMVQKEGGDGWTPIYASSQPTDVGVRK